ITALPDATLPRLIRPTSSVLCRSDKAFMPHPTITALPDATLAELNPKTWTVSVNRLFDTQSGILPG
ncbi:hypothetical protein, partial [Escherichia coli]|uniref:hypothetical protein n=1 Tax=Escherichia coli TaxID=562 RepID=UPI001BC866DC